MSKILLTALLTVFMSAQVSVASTASGTVVSIWSSPTSNYVLFSLPDGSGELNRCNTSGRFAIDLSKPGGTATYELLLIAKQNRYQLSVETLNTCNQYDAENVKNITVK